MMKPTNDDQTISANAPAEAPISIIALNNDDKEDKEHSEHTTKGAPPKEQPQPDDNYDPHDFGKMRRPVRRTEATLLLFKYIVGAGILAIPYTFQQVGYLVGIVGTLLIGILYLHIMHILLKLEYDLCKSIRQPNLTYVGVVDQAFESASPKWRPIKPYFIWMIYFNYGLSNIFFNAVCLIIMAGGLRSVLQHNEIDASLQRCISLIIVPVTVICWIPNLKFLVPFSLLTNVFTIVNVFLILFIPTSERVAEAKPHAVRDLWYFPQFFAIVLGAFSCTGLVLPLKTNMATPKHFTTPLGVMNVSVLLVALVYSCFGTKAYFKYGETLQGNVLSNLPNENILSMIALILYAVAVGISFTYSFYISFDTLWSNYMKAKLKGNRYNLIIKYSMKTLINVVTYLLAIGVPKFELFASLSGSVGILADIGLPPLLENIVLMKEKFTFSKSTTVMKNSLIIMVSCWLFFSALVDSLKAVINVHTT